MHWITQFYGERGANKRILHCLRSVISWVRTICCERRVFAEDASVEGISSATFDPGDTAARSPKGELTTSAWTQSGSA